MSWKDLKAMDWEELSEARLQVHQAVQLIASAAISFLEKKEDDSHTNMTWLNDQKMLAGHLFGEEKRFRLALSIADFRYVLLDEQDTEIVDFPLNMRTVDDAVDWLMAQLRNNGFDPSAFHTRRHYKIPVNKPGMGGIYQYFAAEPFRQISHHFDCAHDVLEELRAEKVPDAVLACWPHHFDLAFLYSVQSAKSGQAKSVGLGFLPGDDYYSKPYYYVSPWPYPEENKLENSELPDGAFWHTRDFVSAIWEADVYTAFKGVISGRERTLDFLKTALGRSEALLTQ